MNQLLDPALKYAAGGWHVFPLRPGQKTPLTAHGVKDATTDPVQIEAWWAKWPDANIGIACGAKSGIYVVDVDVSEAADGLETLKALPDLPKTVRQNTPRGGFHAFFHTTDPPANKNSFLPGIDIRGDGYYVVAAPSIHPNGGQYSWAEGCTPWECGLAEYPDFLRPAARAPQAAPAPAPSLVSASASDRDGIEVARRYLPEVDPAIRGEDGHGKLFWACGCVTHGCELTESQAYDILAREYNPRCVPPWDLSDPKDEKDFRRKITESIKHPPQKPRGWIINDSAYALPKNIVSEETIQQMIANAEQKASPPAAPAAPAEVVTPDNDDFLLYPTGMLGRACSWINATALRSQPILTLACVVAFFGVLFGRKVRDTLGSRTNLYCMGVGPSSAGKAHAANQIRRLCEAADCMDLLGGDDVASDTAIEDRMSRKPATLFLWDEIGHILVHIKSGVSKHHAKVVSLLMKLYSSAGNVYLGREYAENEKQRTITQPCCCVYGTGSPVKFAAGISPDELEDGWLSRCLIFYTPTRPRKIRGIDMSTPPPPEIVEFVRKWAKFEVAKEPQGNDISVFSSGTGDNRTETPPEQIVVPTSSEAEQRLISFDDASERYGEQNPRLACIWAKAEENARRLSLIHAVGNGGEELEVTVQSADWACRLTERLVRDFNKYVVPEIVGGRTESEKRKIVKLVESYGPAGCTKTAVTKGTQWANARQRNDLLTDLAEAADIVAVRIEGTAGTRYWTPEHAPATDGGTP